MFAHIVVGGRDLDEAKRFYDAVLPILGVTLHSDDRAGGWLTYRRDGQRPGFEICRPIDGNPPSVGNGVNVGFLAPNRSAVRAAHAAGLAAGGSSEGAPGLRPYHAHWYGCYLRDPTGNKLCIVCHEPEPPGAS
jgi:catechol 2,3-dioxygenase-like lactoylglutathione lyase family enzyme